MESKVTRYFLIVTDTHLQDPVSPTFKKKYLKRAKESQSELLFPNSLHPHMIRHTKAMHLLETGVNLIYIRDLLGHVNVTTTEIYLRANTETKRKALESSYIDIVTQDVPVWEEDTNLLSWLEEFCQ